jgi:hypothetical protein
MVNGIDDLAEAIDARLQGDGKPTRRIDRCGCKRRFEIVVVMCRAMTEAARLIDVYGDGFGQDGRPNVSLVAISRDARRTSCEWD